MKSAFFLVACLAAVVLAVALMVGLVAHHHQEPPTSPPMLSKPPLVPTPPKPHDAASILGERQELDRTVWKEEVDAQRHEDTFIGLWDGMRARLDDQHVLLKAVPFTSLRIASPGATEDLGWNLTVRRCTEQPRTLDHAQWEQLVDAIAAQGYVLEHSEWHHSAFSHDADGTCHSTVAYKLMLWNAQRQERALVSGELKIVWTSRTDDQGHFIMDSIDASGARVIVHHGEDAFTEAWSAGGGDLAGHLAALGPVLVYDLDGDGRDDIVLPNLNVVLINQSTPGHIAFAKRPLCRFPATKPDRTYITAAVLTDVDGDGHPDLVVCGYHLPPTVFLGDGSASFSKPGRMVPLPPALFVNPSFITAGITGSSRLPDLWIGQYRAPYVDGNVPKPYWDADDSYPSFLLHNLGHGLFRDVTDQAGLQAKRNRRAYSGSFIDLDGDGRPDLLTINDFAGIDAYHNNGDGTFTDCTASLFPERHTYGMSHVIADFTATGRLDLFVAGMSSTTARRLDHMHAGRAEFPEWQRMRSLMAYGNRLYQGIGAAPLRLAPFDDDIARTGWTWGSTAIDVANEGFPSIFVTNGHMSRKTARDYCTRYWTQDIYQATSRPDEAFLAAIQQEDQAMGEVSWNGFEHKGLLKNEQGAHFLDVAYPMNVGFEWDGRACVSADFDGDGKPDLLLVQDSLEQYKLDNAHLPASGIETLHLEVNRMPDHHHWLDVRLVDNPVHPPLGASITVEAGGRTYRAIIVTGDSYRCQHPLCKHFGLGEGATVDRVTVRWGDGATTVIPAPAVDKTLVVRP